MSSSSSFSRPKRWGCGGVVFLNEIPSSVLSAASPSSSPATTLSTVVVQSSDVSGFYSFPKGKIHYKSAETWLEGTMREVHEEINLSTSQFHILCHSLPDQKDGSIYKPFVLDEYNEKQNPSCRYLIGCISQDVFTSSSDSDAYTLQPHVDHQDEIVSIRWKDVHALVDEKDVQGRHLLKQQRAQVLQQAVQQHERAQSQPTQEDTQWIRADEVLKQWRNDSFETTPEDAITTQLSHVKMQSSSPSSSHPSPSPSSSLSENSNPDQKVRSSSSLLDAINKKNKKKAVTPSDAPSDAASSSQSVKATSPSPSSAVASFTPSTTQASSSPPPPPPPSQASTSSSKPIKPINLKTLSVSLSSILRHGNKDSDKVKIRYDVQGYVSLDKLLEKLKVDYGKKGFQQVTKEIIFKVVDENEKKRFKVIYKSEKQLAEQSENKVDAATASSSTSSSSSTTTTSSSSSSSSSSCLPADLSLPSWSYLICATQGHSDAVARYIDASSKYVQVLQPYSVLIHGTTFNAWTLIQQSGGLHRMQRSHIHFICNEPHAEEVISGFRSNIQIKLYIDMKKAMKDGIIFYRSDNNVILTDGVDGNGILPLKYISKAVNF